MLQIKNLNKHYGKKQALFDFEMTFKNGVYGLLGPNGAGKSTTLKTLSGILGHTNASFTLDTYTHVTTDMQRNASTIVGSFMDEIMLEGDDTNR